MKKYILDLKVAGNEPMGSNYLLLKLTQEAPLPEMCAGQFVEIKIEHSPHTLLRRPISINRLDKAKNELWLLIQKVGEGTHQLAQLVPGDTLNVVMPLGNGYSLPKDKQKKILLSGGGVGQAPLLMLGESLKEKGYEPVYLIGARTQSALLEMEDFAKVGTVYTTTEDGSCGEKGFVTQHSVLSREKFDKIYVCGPTPMMKAVAGYAQKNNIDCEVSLENKMACGLGACLCCVTETKAGHQCVCKDGPVFNIKDLTWQN